MTPTDCEEACAHYKAPCMKAAARLKFFRFEHEGGRATSSGASIQIARHAPLTPVGAQLFDGSVGRVWTRRVHMTPDTCPHKKCSSSSPVARAVLLRQCFTVSRLGSVLTHHGKCMSTTTKNNQALSNRFLLLCQVKTTSWYNMMRGCLFCQDLSDEQRASSA